MSSSYYLVANRFVSALLISNRGIPLHFFALCMRSRKLCFSNKKNLANYCLQGSLVRVEGGARTHDIQNHNLTL